MLFKPKKIRYNMYGEDVLTVRLGQNWFAKFQYGNFNVEDALNPGTGGRS